MRCIYKVLFIRVHPGAEKVNAWGKCSPRCSPIGNCQQRYDKRAIEKIENYHIVVKTNNLTVNLIKKF